MQQRTRQRANELCIDQSTLITFESGEKRVSADLLMRIANVLEVPAADYFFQRYIGE